MKKDEMVTLLRSVGCDENTVTAMINAYEMGFEQGAIAFKQISVAMEDAAQVCKSVDKDDLVGAKESAKLFWDSIGRVREME
jgi:hypothetical protein